MGRARGPVVRARARRPLAHRLSRILHALLSRLTRSAGAIVAISALAFGLIHWSLGLHAVVITTAIGALLMIAYLRTRALPALMLAHFAINFIDFAGVVPKSIFRLL